MKEAEDLAQESPSLKANILWWVIRVCFFYGTISSALWFLERPPKFATAIGRPVQNTPTQIFIMMLAYLVLCFLWEIFQLLPKKNLFRNLPSYFQSISLPFCLVTGFLGAFMNFYYRLWWWDKWIHCMGGFCCALLGYEIFAALQKKHDVAIPKAMIFLAMFGMCCIIGTCWELFEVSMDQFTGSDTQHWNVQLAEAAGMTRHVFPPPAWGGQYGPNSWIWEHRFALMDTMGDIICNTIGGIACMIFIKLHPYCHKNVQKKDKLWVYSRTKNN